MRWRSVLSGLWLFAVLSAVVGTGVTRVASNGERRTQTTGVFAAGANYVTTPDGARGVADADGRATPIRPYARIGSSSMVADELLLSLVEPERIATLSEYGRKNAEDAHLYGARPTTAALSDIEGLLGQKLDLLLVHNIGSEAQLARVRDAGVVVFNLGEMRGLATLLPNIQAVSALLDVPERGERLAQKFMRRMTRVAAGLPEHERKRAIYLSAFNNNLYGGTRGTSYHDVLTQAGLIDAAARDHHDWPAYDPEILLALDPERVVTPAGMAASICRIHGLERLRACADEHRGVVEMPEGLMENPGLSMLEAVEVLFERVYGARTGRLALVRGAPAVDR